MVLHQQSTMLAWVSLALAILAPLLYYIHHTLALPPRPLPSAQNVEKGGKINVLLAVAHPDDESMFFGPTLLSLAKLGNYNIRTLCFSTGNADGLGSVRKLEMVAACSVLQIPGENVNVVDHPALQDGFSSQWDQSLIVQLLKECVSAHNIQIVMTFDSHGVSGHPNHRAVYNGVRTFMMEVTKRMKSTEEGIQCWELVSTSILRKYTGPLEIYVPLYNSEVAKLHKFINPSPWTSIVAMSRHQSQWVWYRRLFVLFARYTYVNTLKLMKA